MRRHAMNEGNDRRRSAPLPPAFDSPSAFGNRSGELHYTCSDWKLFWATNASGVWVSTYVGERGPAAQGI